MRWRHDTQTHYQIQITNICQILQQRGSLTVYVYSLHSWMLENGEGDVMATSSELSAGRVRCAGR